MFLTLLIVFQMESDYRILLFLLSSFSAGWFRVDGLIVKDAVIYNKIGEIATTNSGWKISLVIDLYIYEELTNQFLANINEITKLMEWANRQYQTPNRSQYKKHFEDLEMEIKFLNHTRKSIHDNFQEYQNLKRERRSVIPIVGDMLSFLFGTTSESDLEDIRGNINRLDQNQNTIKHVMEQSLSILNISRTEIGENRGRINKLYGSMKTISNELLEAVKEEHDIEEFLHSFLQLDSMIANAREMLREIEHVYLELKMQLNFIAIGKLNPSVISPKQLKNILIDIEKQLPKMLALPMDPRTQLLDYFKLLSCTSIMIDQRIVIIIMLPLVDINGNFKIYKAHSLPIPLNWSNHIPESTRTEEWVAEYKLESAGLAINSDRTRYALINEEIMERCLNLRSGACNLKRPTYPVNIAENCIVSLLMDKRIQAQNSCQVELKSTSNFPQAKYIAQGVWAIITLHPLKFRVLCQNGQKPSNVYIQPPIDIISLNKTCTATSDLITLPAHYSTESKYFVRQEIIEKLNQVNITQSNIWQPLHKTHTKLSTLIPPSKLKTIQATNINQLIDKLTDIHNQSENITEFPIWGFIGIVSLSGIFIIIIVYCCKNKKIKHPCARELSRIKRDVEHKPMRDDMPQKDIELTTRADTRGPLYPEITALKLSVDG